MTYSNIFKKYRKEINTILNVTCDICGDSYMTAFTLVKYCGVCMERVEREVE